MEDLRDLLRNAARYVPFYREHWRASGVDFDALEQSPSLAAVPIVYKRDLLASAAQDRLDKRHTSRNLAREKTSGSSGEPFEMTFSRLSNLRRKTRFLRALWAVGYRPGNRMMLISSRHFSAKARALGWIYVDLRNGEAQLASAYQQHRPDVLYGPLSSLLALSDQLRDEPNLHRPRVVISTAEALGDAQRSTLRSRFCDNVADFYGMSEFGLLAWRAGSESTYHTLHNDFVLEFAPSDFDATLERLIVTDLRSQTAPLIRYDTGDLVRRDHSRPEKPILNFIGREVDCIRLPDGRRISPYRFTMSMEEIPEIDRYQIVQQPNWALDVYVHTLLPDAASALTRAREAIDAVCEGALPITVHRLDAPPAAIAGKVRPVRSLIRGGP